MDKNAQFASYVTFGLACHGVVRTLTSVIKKDFREVIKYFISASSVLYAEKAELLAYAINTRNATYTR
jgi:hypothetical protein